MSLIRSVARPALLAAAILSVVTNIDLRAQDTSPTPAARLQPLKLLFLGDNGHHRPGDRAVQLLPVMERRGITIQYTDDVAVALQPQALDQFDGLILFANIDEITEPQAKALLDYVGNGHGFIPLHCASYCFRNNADVVGLIGAQFQRHGTGVFRVHPTQSAQTHPIMQGYGGFESWDETYVHTKHNEVNRTILEYRLEGDAHEPWTWIRTHGKGRVFYTAWGHDQRTWSNPGFHNLVERGIRWACGGDPAAAGEYLDDLPFPVPQMTALRKDVKPFDYIDVGAEIPNYTPSEKWGTQGKPLNMMQVPLPPEESIKHLVVPEGFRVELFASEPDLGGKPICMAWDERGRLWVAETYDYPNELQPPGKGRDRIRICEDTNGDGKADKFTVFAENLSIPTSIAFSRGGVIVQDGVETLYLKDTNGDDKADERRVMFSGWDLGDTHGGVSNFQYGLDNWIWAMQGYNTSNPHAEGAEGPRFRMGFFRFKPDGSEVEFIRSTNNNTWGLGISEEGLIFGSTANRNPSDFMPIANRYYESVRGWTPSLTLQGIADTFLFKPITNKVRQVDQHGGYTAATGHALYTGRQFPREYWNRVAFVNGPTGHLTGAFVLKADGSGFRSTSPFNLVASDDEWTAPIMSEVGPDGTVWVIDWYNYIVQHNPTPEGFQTGKGRAYETKLRDKKHGRIYRVVYSGNDVASVPNLAKATPEQLVQHLANPTMLVRRHAQRLLVERGQTDVVPALLQLVKDDSRDVIGLNVCAIHALWTMRGLGVLDGRNTDASQAAMSALRHPSGGVRRNALQVLPAEPQSVEALIAAGVLDDSNAQVRLAAVLALADLPVTAGSGQAVLNALQNEQNIADAWLPDALTSAAAHNSVDFLRAVAGAKNPSQRVVDITRLVANHYARGNDVSGAAQLVASLSSADTRIADAVISGLNDGWRTDVKVALTPETEAAMEALLEKLSPGVKGTLVRLATNWGSGRFEQYASMIARSLLSVVADDNKPEPERIASARQLVEFLPGSESVVEDLLDLVTPRTPLPVTRGIIESMEAAQTASAGDLLVERLSGLTPDARSAAFVVLLKRPALTRALLAGADSGLVSINDLALDQKQALASHPDRSIRDAARRLLEMGGSLPNPDRQKVLEELLGLTERSGDAARGKEVFKKHCSKCHTHSGEGEKVGPDLTGMAVHPKRELLTHIIDPSRSVEGNFRVYTIITGDGRVLNGMLASESRTALEIFDAEGKKKAILREDIDELVASRKSLMPEGFEKQVKEEELTDLLEFLTKRGRFLPLDLAKVATIASDRSMFVSQNNEAERLIFPDWQPKMFKDVPFTLIDPQSGKVPNVVMLHSPNGPIANEMPRGVELPCSGSVKSLHLLSGVSGWGHPYGDGRGVTMIVRFHYADGQQEDHKLLNGVHFADYIRRVDVPESEFAFALRGQQIRYLAIHPQRAESITKIEFLKGDDRCAPVVMAATIESP